MSKPQKLQEQSKRSESVINHVATSTCPTCGSSERTAYNNCTFQPLSGIDGKGNSYIGVWWRYCKCEACGQNRIDKSFDYSVERKQ